MSNRWHSPLFSRDSSGNSHAEHHTWNSRTFAAPSCFAFSFQAASCRGVWGCTVLPWSEGTMSGHGSAFSQCSYRHKLWCLVGGKYYISPQYVLFAVLLDNSTAENGLCVRPYHGRIKNVEGAHRFMPLYTETEICALWWFTHVPQQPPKKKHDSIRKAPVHETTFAG